MNFQEFKSAANARGATEAQAIAELKGYGFDVDSDIPDDIATEIINDLAKPAGKVATVKSGGLATTGKNVTITQARKMQPFEQQELLGELTVAASEGRAVNDKLVKFLTEAVGAAAAKTQQQVGLANKAITALEILAEQGADANRRLAESLTFTLGSGGLTEELFDGMEVATDSFRASASHFEQAHSIFDDIIAGSRV